MPTPPTVVVPQCRSFPYLYTRIRDLKSSNETFAFYSSRIMTVLAEEALGLVPSAPFHVETPTQAMFAGTRLVEDESRLCLVSIIRAGDSLMEAARKLVPQAAVGKILIQRDESSKEKLPILFYSKLPPDIAARFVILCDPMLGTGGSALCALDIIVQQGFVSPKRIVYVCVVASPEGLQAVHAKYPEVQIVAGAIDEGLNEEKYIMPGLGDFGDRFYNTTTTTWLKKEEEG